jgi:dehydrogenase/reductase SDR family protein 12
LGRTGYLKHVQSYYTEPVQKAACIPIGAAGADDKDLTGQVVVVTGANSGLGRQVATYAAAKGAKLYMLCRNKERAEQARNEMMKEIQNAAVAAAGETNQGSNDSSTFQPNIEILLADVAELEQVRKVAAELQSKEEKVHCIVCNAGVLLNEKEVNSEGYEMTFASHVLGGSYLLPQLLVPQLTAAGAQARVITVTSGGMYNVKLPSWKVLSGKNDDSDDNTTDVKYNGSIAYCYAKRAQVLLSEQRAQDMPDIKWVTVHPGWADTNAVDEAFGDNKKYLMPLRDAWEGAEGVAWLVATDASHLENGAFYLDRKTQPKHVAGPFFSEGSYTKNKPQEVQEFMKKLKEATE